MLRTTLFAVAVATLPALPASAQTAAERFSYSAPSGMFSEGTTKWQNYRFLFEDQERTARFNAGQPTSTGSVQGSAINTETYRRPGEASPKPRRAR